MALVNVPYMNLVGIGKQLYDSGGTVPIFIRVFLLTVLQINGEVPVFREL